MSKSLNELSREELLEYIKNLKREKKFGLVWEDKPEQVAIDCQTMLPILRSIEDKTIKCGSPTDPTHLIIEGDNYHSLSALNYTHAGKIDIIYIDPPYNTGNKDFIYNDRFVDEEDAFKHSKWLSFMSKRLRLAKDLLRFDGMLFVSIDDNELANLKLLCDQVFGSENYINCISVKTKNSSGASGGGEDKRLKKHVEYLLFYAKDKSRMQFIPQYSKANLMETIEEKRSEGKSYEYKSVLIDPGERALYKIIKDGSGNNINIFKHVGFKVSSVARIMREEGLTEEECYIKYYEQIFRGQPAQSSIRTRVNEATSHNPGLFSIEYIPRSGKRKGQLATNYYYKEDLVNWLSDTVQKENGKLYKYVKLGTLWSDLSWNGLSSEGGISFSNGKKPVSFVKRIIQHHPNKDACVLDFFAGSGTTAEAVMQLNQEDNGKRLVIVCNNSSDVAKEHDIVNTKLYPRFKNVIYGYGARPGIPSNLRVFQTDFVKKEKTNIQTRNALIEKCCDMICVREGAYDSLTKNESFRIFGGPFNDAAIVFNPDRLSDLVSKLELRADRLVNIYIFSQNSYAYEKDFPETTVNYTLCPIPESILEVYRRIFEERKL